jgi:hypothetical protein
MLLVSQSVDFSLSCSQSLILVCAFRSSLLFFLVFVAEVRSALVVVKPVDVKAWIFSVMATAISLLEVKGSVPEL